MGQSQQSKHLAVPRVLGQQPFAQAQRLGQVLDAALRLSRFVFEQTEPPVRGHQVTGGRAIPLGGRDQGLADRDLLAIARQGPCRVAEVGPERVALDVADLLIGRRQLGLEHRIAARLPGEAVQVLERLLHHELARRCRARQVVDGLFELEQELVRQPAHVREPRLGARPVRLGDALLAHDGEDPGHQDQHHQGRAGHRHTVPADELAGPVAERVRPRPHRPALQVPAHVLRELLDRGVAPRRILVQGLSTIVSRSPSAPPAMRRVAAARLHGRARRRRVRLAHRAHDLLHASPP